MRIKYNLEYVDMGEEFIAVPVGEDAQEMKGVLKLNSFGAEICQCLKNDVTSEAIVNHLQTKYENDTGTLKSYVISFIENLRNLGLIDE